MAKFVYRMQNILDVKYKLETQAQTAYGEANARLVEEELKLERIYDDINRYEDEIRANSSNVVNIEELKWCTNAIRIKKLEAEAQKKAIERARREAELARIKLNEAMVDRKTHEKLREKAFDEFKLEVAEAESKEIDELVSFQFSKSE